MGKMENDVLKETDWSHIEKRLKQEEAAKITYRDIFEA